MQQTNECNCFDQKECDCLEWEEDERCDCDFCKESMKGYLEYCRENLDSSCGE